MTPFGVVSCSKAHAEVIAALATIGAHPEGAPKPAFAAGGYCLRINRR